MSTLTGFAKAIVVVILAVAFIVVMVNMAFFFPWYSELIERTFQVSQMVSTDNYLSYDKYTLVYDNICAEPIFKERTADIKIEAVHESGKNAIEMDGPWDVNTHYYPLDDESSKPYEQMGKLVDITIHAAYPFRMQMFGRDITVADIPVSFQITTTTTHHYKDLPYNYGVDGDMLDDFELEP